jgi:hypothetical protein
VHVQYVLADPAAQIVGTLVAEDAPRQMAVYRVDGLLRTSTSITGWHGDSWTAPRFDWTRHNCTGGTLRVPIHSDSTLFAGVVQQIAVSGDVEPLPFVVHMPSTAERTIVVRLRSHAGVCHVRFDVTPSRKPPNDPRTLGVLVSGFEYAPPSG